MSSNGQLPASELAPIAQGQLRKDAAAAWNSMNIEARRLGCELYPTGSMSSYRSIEQQRVLYARYLAGTGSLAARPSTSNHGWGLAVDLATLEMRSMVDRIGSRWGFSKRTSDAPSEWWHIAWVVGSWRGPDPGPYGKTTPALPELAAQTKTVVLVGHDAFVETDSGEVFHSWLKENVGWVSWQSFGRPGH